MVIDAPMRQAMLDAIPHLRAFAISWTACAPIRGGLLLVQLWFNSRALDLV
jgi:hypothetical protein